jgi:predicted nucleic acid-binding protein
VILCDAGPLFALIDKKQHQNHSRCRKALAQLAAPLITTWPCFTEAMYLAYRSGGWPMQKLLWRFVNEGVLEFYDLAETDISRMQILMAQYRNVPMDIADASLVVTAEALTISRIFTLDSDFRVYQIGGSTPFEVYP